MFNASQQSTGECGSPANSSSIQVTRLVRKRRKFPAIPSVRRFGRSIPFTSSMSAQRTPATLQRIGFRSINGLSKTHRSVDGDDPWFARTPSGAVGVSDAGLWSVVSQAAPGSGPSDAAMRAGAYARRPPTSVLQSCDTLHQATLVDHGPDFSRGTRRWKDVAER